LQLHKERQRAKLIKQESPASPEIDKGNDDAQTDLNITQISSKASCETVQGKSRSCRVQFNMEPSIEPFETRFHGTRFDLKSTSDLVTVEIPNPHTEFRPFRFRTKLLKPQRSVPDLSNAPDLPDHLKRQPRSISMSGLKTDSDEVSSHRVLEDDWSSEYGSTYAITEPGTDMSD